VKRARCTVCSSVTVTAPVTRSRRVTNTLSCPTSSSVHDIALQRTISMGILVTPALAEEAAAVVLSSSTSADMALHRIIIITVLWQIVCGFESLSAFHSPPVY
jgi:hypothetical protein